MASQILISTKDMNTLDKVAMRCKMDWWFEDYRDYENDSLVWSDDISNVLEDVANDREIISDFTEDEKSFIEKMIGIFY